MSRRFMDKPNSPRSTASSADSHTVHSINVASSMTTSKMCVCGKSSIPWVHQQTKSDINNNILQLQTLQNTGNSFGYSLPLDEEELKRSICTERIRIEKDRLLAAFDLVMMIKGGLEVSASNQSCSWGKYAAAAAATNTTIARKPQEDAVRQMITRSQLCLECALNLADSSWQDTTFLSKSSCQKLLSSPAGDGSLDCFSSTPLSYEMLEVDTKSSNVDSNDPSDEEQQEKLIMLPLLDSVVLESKIEEATDAPQNINTLISASNSPQGNFRNDRNKEERVETSCDNAVRSEKKINHKEEAPFILGVQSFDTLVLDFKINEETEGTRQIDVWRRSISTTHQAQAICTVSERTLSLDKLKGLLYTSSDVFSSEDVTTELLIESSLLTSGIDVKNAVINHVQDLYQKRESPPAAARLTYGVQNINARTAQYVQGFPFVREKSSNPNIFSITLCPPHNLESVTPDNVEFDLGFRVLKSEKDNTAFVAIVAKNSPAVIVGIKSTDKIRFAFAHTLSSPFRAFISKFGSVSLLTHDSLDLSTSCAVYHAPEVESVQAAEYAMACIGDGATTTFEEFNLLFPFDVTKPLGAHSPASFKVGEDPILYPVTVVFERSDFESEDSSVILDEVFGDVSESAEQVLGRVLSCLGGSRCSPHSPDDMHGAKGDNFVRPAPIFLKNPHNISTQVKQPNLIRRSAF